MRVWLLALALAAGCVDPPPFGCGDQPDCGPNGRCEASGFCSFPDPACPSGYRYGDLSGGGLAGQCASPAPPDAGPAANYVFVTHDTYITSNYTPEIADTHCNDSAVAAGLSGTYVAWLGFTGMPAPSRLLVPGTGTRARGWVRLDGKPFADRVEDITAGKIYYPIKLDSANQDASTRLVVTGTFADGAVGDNCDDWTFNSGYTGGVPSGGTVTWTQTNAYDCMWQASLYCFGVDRIVEVPPPSATGRFAFVSRGGFGPNATSVPCQSEADIAGLPGTYRAFVANVDVPAVSLFDTGGAPWVRPDGVLLADTADAFMTSSHLASLSADASASTYYGGRVWSGAVSPQLDPSGTACDNWTNPSGGTANYGIAGHSRSPDWFAAVDGFGTPQTVGCNAVFPVYCLQQ